MTPDNDEWTREEQEPDWLRDIRETLEEKDDSAPADTDWVREDPGAASPWREEAPPRRPEVRPAYVESPGPEKETADVRQKSNAPLVVLLIVLLAGLAFAGWKLAGIALNYRRDRAAYSDIAENAVTLPAATEKPAPTEKPASAALPASSALPAIPTPTATPVSEVPISGDWA